MTFFPLPHIEDCHKRVRAFIRGVCIIDSYNAKLVWTHPLFPCYFFPDSELPMILYLQQTYATSELAHYSLGDASGSGLVADAITRYFEKELAGLFTMKFSVADAWFEEEEEVYVHPKDPYKRVDVLQSSRHVRIEISGVEVANTKAPRLLYETSFPVRYYIPKLDCRMDLWEPSSLVTKCPYKGEANYYHIRLPSSTEENIAWFYQLCTPECATIKGYVAFFDEKVDVWVDGVKQERPVTEWS